MLETELDSATTRVNKYTNTVVVNASPKLARRQMMSDATTGAGQCAKCAPTDASNSLPALLVINLDATATVAAVTAWMPLWELYTARLPAAATKMHRDCSDGSL